MVPEQFRGKTVLATNLYGLRVTVIFLLTQKAPADLPRRILVKNNKIIVARAASVAL